MACMIFVDFNPVGAQLAEIPEESDYIELLDATGREVREDKHGAIAAGQSSILQQPEIDPETWLHIATTFEHSCVPWIGENARLEQVCRNVQEKHWICSTEKTSSCIHPEHCSSTENLPHITSQNPRFPSSHSTCTENETQRREFAVWLVSEE